MLKLAGYADRLSARPGDTINFRLSNATGKPVNARFVRVICADPNPAGPGIREVAVPVELPHLAAGFHATPQGSYAVADLGDTLVGLTDFTLVMTIQPTLPPPSTAAPALVLGIGSAASPAPFSLTLQSDGALALTFGPAMVVSAPLTVGEWVDVAAVYNAATRSLELSIRPVRHGANWQRRHVILEGEASLPPTRATLHCAGWPSSALTSFNGRIENPHLYRSVLTETERDATRGPVAVSPDTIFAFDFAAAISSARIVDNGPNERHGVLVNHPTRAIRSSRWTGREMCFRHAPHEYAAIHFHADDMTDCQWPTALAWQVPDDFASGCYALRVDADGASENIPFFIVPPKGRPTAKIAVLVSTFTYTVYANHARPEYRLSTRWAKAWREQAADWHAYPENPADHPDYTWSTYNDHPDGSGISISSWHRPMLNTRVGYMTYPYADMRGSGLRHYPADTHLHTWLEDQGIAFDIITDQELHDEGIALLRDYTVVLTGTHPEYHTREMLDALAHYRDTGGRLMYLGGNGFYWKIALDPDRPGVVEIRRGEGGIRAWAAQPGEYYNQFDGEYGGLWRRNGRPPQELCGVGFSAQGNFVGSHYVADEQARTSRAAWILAGIEGPLFGGHGLSGHGAAGFELDRADKALGTAKHAIIVATSEGHEPEAPWVLVPEERLTHLTNISGESEPELIRSDIVFFETPANGAVFSVGSITYCGSLLTDGGNNDISRLTRNVLDRFADPDAIFEIPMA